MMTRAAYGGIVALPFSIRFNSYFATSSIILPIQARAIVSLPTSVWVKTGAMTSGRIKVKEADEEVRVDSAYSLTVAVPGRESR